MIWFDVIRGAVLGLVQGFSEFLPISSSGHLILLPNLVGWQDQGLAFDTVLHLGTLAALLWFFGGELRTLIQRSRVRETQQEAILFFLKIALATLPAVIAALLFGDWIEANARSVNLVAFNLAFWGLILFIADRTGAKNSRDAYLSISFMQAFLLGCAQALALIPGTSRSGITITAALFLGFSRAASARIGFLLALPVTFLAGTHGLWKISGDAVDTNAVMLISGFIAAAVSGAFAIKFLLSFISKHHFDAFVIYRLALALLVVSLAT